MTFFIYVRSTIGGLIFILHTMLFSSIMLTNLIFRNRDFPSWVIRVWAQITMKIWNIHVEVQGRENIPPGGHLFVFNHSSHLDIPVVHAANLHRSYFGAKIELFSIPIFGAAMRVAGVLPIVRADRNKVLKLYDESIQRVRGGDSFLLAGEGTRQPVPGVGEKFKAGPFIFAINGQFPIVPVVLCGVGEMLPKDHVVPCTSHWRSTVTVRFLKPILTAGLTLDDRERLQTETREIMAKAYQELEHSRHKV